MNKYIFIFFAALFLTACNNKADQPIIETDTDSNLENVSSWQATLNDSSGRLEMKKIGTAGPDTLDVAPVIGYLNTANPNIVLQFLKRSNDTVYLRISEAMYLTQQMGSTGPTLYFADVVYNLTEIAGIRYINFDFEEGDHASPGTYNRDSFKDE